MPLSYSENPSKAHFQGQDPDEKILLLLRAHPITNLPWIITAILLFSLPYFLPIILPFFSLSLPSIPEAYALSFLIVNYLLVLVVVFEGFLNWYFNVYIVTNKKIIDLDFHSLLFKNTDIALLNQVQDASGSVGGLLGIIFHYGHVFIQTAGSNQTLDFHNVPMPEHVADFIIDLAEKVQGGKNAGGPNP